MVTKEQKQADYCRVWKMQQGIQDHRKYRYCYPDS